MQAPPAWARRETRSTRSMAPSCSVPDGSPVGVALDAAVGGIRRVARDAGELQRAGVDPRAVAVAVRAGTTGRSGTMRVRALPSSGCRRGRRPWTSRRRGSTARRGCAAAYVGDHARDSRRRSSSCRSHWSISRPLPDRMDVRVLEPGQEHAAGEVDTSVCGPDAARGRRRRRRPRRSARPSRRRLAPSSGRRPPCRRRRSRRPGRRSSVRDQSRRVAPSWRRRRSIPRSGQGDEVQEVVAPEVERRRRASSGRAPAQALRRTRCRG